MQVDDAPADAEQQLGTLIADARRNNLAHVEVFALDALARIAAAAGDITRARELCETADRRIEDASDFITDLDRVDARAVRQLT